MAKMFSTAEVAHLVGIPRPTLGGWISRGRYDRAPQAGAVRWYSAQEVMGLCILHFVGVDAGARAFRNSGGFASVFDHDGVPLGRFLVMTSDERFVVVDRLEDVAPLLIGFGFGWLCDLRDLSSAVAARATELP